MLASTCLYSVYAWFNSSLNFVGLRIWSNFYKLTKLGLDEELEAVWGGTVGTWIRQ